MFTNVRGEERVIAWKSAPVTDETGLVRSIVAGGLDITDRERVREPRPVLDQDRARRAAVAFDRR